MNVRKPVVVKKPVKPKSSESIITMIRRRMLLSHSKAEKQKYMKRLNTARKELAGQRKKAA